MDYEEMLSLIEKITPHGKDYVKEGLRNNKVDILYSLNNEENKGVFVKVDNQDCCIFYAVFFNENHIEEIMKIIENKTREYLIKENSKEICFNVYGENIKIIKLVKKLGFKTDMEGYHLQFVGKEIPELNRCNLKERGFEDSELKKFIDLFDGAYYKLNLDNGWKVNSNSENGKQFCEELKELNKHNKIHSFWIDEDLIGTYIIEKNYISDIVVNPLFQNRGYGSYILKHCIRYMVLERHVENIRLRVAKSNVGAKEFYERNNFVQIASFAEHTYI